ncbi:MAG: hypothetical protein IJP48_08205 [Synergistaceae bacterium]|nr:hypothetical protein [Synergistaceae bacterium]
MSNVILYFHWLSKNLQGFDVLGVNYDDKNLPHIVKSQIQKAYDMTSETRSMLS